MSYDVSVVEDGEDVFSVNYTWNMAYAIRHGGLEIYKRHGWLYSALTHPSQRALFVLEGARASAAATAIADAITLIQEDAEKLREREPVNGWGSVQNLISCFLLPLLRACRECPNAVLRCC